MKQFEDCEHCGGTGKQVTGRYLRALRERNKLNLKDIAARCGNLTIQYLSDIERGRRRATPEIARAYGVE